MRRFAELDSTNRYLLGEAAKGGAEGLVAVAGVQRDGRGRRGRRWDAPAGTSLLVSILLRPALPVERLHLAVACTAVAAAEACAGVTGTRPGLKWPNDLVVGTSDAKLAGILAEVDLPAVVVGLGLNCDWPAGSLPAGAAALGPVDRDALLDALLAELGILYGDWPRVAERYRAACVTVGRRVRVETAAETFSGTAVAVSDDGHLLVAPTDPPADPPAGPPAGPAADPGPALRTVVAGDLVHLRPDVAD